MIRIYSDKPKIISPSDHSPDFQANLIGYLPDAIECVVTEERNGTFELSITYPFNGKNYEYIVPGNYVCCKPGVFKTPQFFKIAEVKQSMNGEKEVTGYHLSYDLINYITGGASLAPEQASMITPQYLWDYCVDDYYGHLYPHPDQEHPFPFVFGSDMGPSELWSGWNSDCTYRTVRSVIGGDDEEGMLAIWPDGEFGFNNYFITFNDQNSQSSRGKDKGVTIIYGKNMTDLSNTVNGVDLYDGVMPIWTKEHTTYKLARNTAYPDTWYAPIIWRDYSTGSGRQHDSNKEKLYLLDLSDRWDDRPSNEELLSAGLAWLKNTDYSQNKQQITVSFLSMADAIVKSGIDRYNLTADEIEQLNAVDLCDIVTVYHPGMTSMYKTKVVKTEYNVLTGHYNSIELGEISASLATTLESLSGGSGSVINVDASKAVKDAMYRITEVNWLSNTQFEVKAKSAYKDSDADYTGASDEVTNVYSIETDGEDVIFDNTTTAPTEDSIYFKDWPTMSENDMAIVPSRLYPTYFGTKVFGRTLTTGDNYPLEGIQFQSMCFDGTYIYIAACDDQDADGCIIRMKPDGSNLTVGPRITDLGHAKIMYQGGNIYSAQRKLRDSWSARGVFQINASSLASEAYNAGDFPHIIAFVQNGSKNYYINDAQDKMYEFEITNFSQHEYTSKLIANLPRPNDFYSELGNGGMQAWSFDGRYIACIRNSPQFAMVHDISSHATRLAKIGDISDYRNLGEIEAACTFNGKTIWLCANDVTDPVVDNNGNQMGETYITFWYMCMTRGEAGSLSLRENMHPNHNLPHGKDDTTGTDSTTTRNICVNTAKTNFYCDGSSEYPFHCLSEAIDRCNRNGDYGGIHFQSNFTGFVRAFNKKIRFTRANNTLNVKLRFTDIQSCEFICDGIQVHDCEMYHSSLWVVNDASFGSREFNNYFRSNDEPAVSKLYNGSYRNNMFRYSVLYVKNNTLADDRKANDIFIDSKIIVMDENDGH